MPDDIVEPVAPDDDPRMRGFRRRWLVEEVFALIERRVEPLGVETADLLEAAGRVLAVDQDASDPVPSFDRAAMDGYAVRGEETFGASSYNPATFRVVGTARPGKRFEGNVGPGEAVEIATGSPLPDGADAVVKVESTALLGTTLAVFEATSPWRHVGRIGEDIAAGTTVLRAGRVLRPQDLGVLSAIGVRDIPVCRRPRVAIIVTGDELLQAGTRPSGYRIADANSVMLHALVERDGGISEIIGPVVDEWGLLRETIAGAVNHSDMLIISGGSSAGPDDHAPGVLAELGEVAAHGVAIRPASPTGLGFIGMIPVLLAPGNPVSCLCAYDFFGGRIVRKLGGRPLGWPYCAAVYPLRRKLVSVVGRVDYARVRVEKGRALPLAISGASILSSTTRADGFVVVPADLEGYAEGADVTVWHYDAPEAERWLTD